MGKASTVIKSSEVSLVPPSPSPRATRPGALRSFHLNDVMDEAKAYVADAHARGAAIIADAHARAKALREGAGQQGYQAGYAAGQSKGLAEGREAGRHEALAAASKEFALQQANLVEACKQIISGINADRQAWWQAARRDLVELAMAIARRVTHHAGQEHREVVLANLQEAVRIAGARTEVTIAISPQDAETARTFARSLMDMKEQWENVRVVEDAQIAPGGCRVHWGSGSIDATLETQLDRITGELNLAP